MARMTRIADLSALRALTSTITNIQTNTHGAKMLRASISLLRCMMFFDLCYLITGISLITVGLTNDYFNRERMIILGGAFGAAASVSAICNSLAAHGLRSWKRGFLVPWLIYYLILILYPFDIWLQRKLNFLERDRTRNLEPGSSMLLSFLSKKLQIAM